MSPIYDRSQEHLGVSDTGIATTRRLLLESVRKLRETGAVPQGVTDPSTYLVRAVSLTLPAGQPWQDGGLEHIKAKLHAGFGYTP